MLYRSDNIGEQQGGGEWRGGGVILRNLKIRGDDFQLCFHIFYDKVFGECNKYY